MATKNTIRAFAHRITNANTTSIVPLYRSAEFPGPAAPGDVYGQITSFQVKSNIHTPPLEELNTQWSGISANILLKHPGGEYTAVTRLDFLSSAVPYRINLLALFSNNQPFYLQAGAEIAIQMLMPLAVSQSLDVWGSAVEERFVMLQEGVGAINFLDLLDVPDTFTASKFVAVNSDANALEFVNLPDPPEPELELGIIAKTSTSEVLELSHRGKFITLDNANPITLIIPANSTVNFPVGTQIIVGQKGIGAVTIDPATGVNLNGSNDNLSLNGRWSGVATLIQYSVNNWWVFGGMAE